MINHKFQQSWSIALYKSIIFMKINVYEIEFILFIQVALFMTCFICWLPLSTHFY